MIKYLTLVVALFTFLGLTACEDEGKQTTVIVKEKESTPPPKEEGSSFSFSADEDGASISIESKN